MLGLNLSASVRPTNAWWTPGAIFAADFVNDRYMRDGVNISRDAALTVTRPSPKLARTLAGEWLSFPPNTLARTDRGASIEPASTNYVQNSTMAGAIPGAPGTAPTGWTVPTSSNGLVRQITAVGTSKGLPHIDIRFSGTTTAESFLNLYLCPGYVPTLPSDSWSLSCNIALIAGSLSGLIPTLACRLRAAMFNASAGYLGELMTNPTLDFTHGEVMQVQSAVVTNAAVRFLSPYVQFWYENAASIDFTVRIRAPQFEPSAPTSQILTTAGAGTRAADAIQANLPQPSEIVSTYSDGTVGSYAADALPLLETAVGQKAALLVEGF
jgi:hypothetical protein